MTLNVLTGVSVESWVELDDGAEMRVECDYLSDCATLYFGSHNDFVLTMYRQHLRNLLDTAERAYTELETAAGERAERARISGDQADALG